MTRIKDGKTTIVEKRHTQAYLDSVEAYREACAVIDAWANRTMPFVDKKRRTIVDEAKGRAQGIIWSAIIATYDDIDAKGGNGVGDPWETVIIDG